MASPVNNTDLQTDMIDIDSPQCIVLDPSQYEKVNQVVTKWISYANAKREEAEKLDDIDEFTTFDYSKLVLGYIQATLENPKEDEDIVICLDSTGTLQSIASIDALHNTNKSTELFIRNIASNPCNLRSILNKGNKILKGASYNLIKFIEELSYKSQRNLLLNPLGPATKLYRRCGFVDHKDTGLLIKALITIK